MDGDGDGDGEEEEGSGAVPADGVAAVRAVVPHMDQESVTLVVVTGGIGEGVTTLVPQDAGGSSLVNGGGGGCWITIMDRDRMDGVTAGRRSSPQRQGEEGEEWKVNNEQ